MALNTDTYTPSAELMELIRRYMSGDKSVEQAIREASLRDPKFLHYFNKCRAGMKSGASREYSIGTRGSRLSGPNANSEVGGWNKGASAWNQHRNERSGIAGSPTSPGGFKASDSDEDSALRRSGKMTSSAVMRNIRFDDDDNLIIGKRKYNKAQRDAILQRGMSGATMNWSDQAVYDAMVQAQEASAQKQEAMRQQKEADRKKAADDEIRKNRNKAIYKKFNIDSKKYSLSDGDLDAIAGGTKMWTGESILSPKDYDDARTRSRDKYIKEESDKRKDALDRAERSVKAGTHRYTKEQSDKMSSAQEEIDRIMFDENIDEYDKERQISKLKKIIENVRMNPHENIVPEQTNEEKLEKMKIGDTGLYIKPNGELDVMPTKGDGRKEYILKRIKEMRDLFGKVDTTSPTIIGKGNVEIKNPNYGNSFDSAEAAREAAKEWDMVENGTFAEEAPAEDSDPIVVNPFDPLVNPNGYAQDSPYNSTQPTNTGGDQKWDVFFDVKPNAGEEEMQAIADYNCPVCGAQLDFSGNCQVCGHPDQELVAAWRQANETEVQ